MTIVFILIYSVSFVIHIRMCYQENKRHIFNVGDLIDEIEPYMWFPVLNTLVLIIVAITMAIIKLWKLSRLNILWEKFRNIKLK